MRVGSMCSGIDGLALGLEAHGMTTVWQSEIDPYAVSQLERHWPDVTRYGDLAATDWSRAEPVDVVCVGYPCQPFSHAGRRKGADDERHLWPHIRDALRVLRPRYVLAENVRGHLTLGFDAVLADLAALGYCVRWQVLRASDVGAPHRRERLFWVATHAHQQPRLARRGAAPGQEEGGRARSDARGSGRAPAAHADRQGPQGRRAHPERGGERPAGAGGVAAAADAAGDTGRLGDGDGEAAAVSDGWHEPKEQAGDGPVGEQRSPFGWRTVEPAGVGADRRGDRRQDDDGGTDWGQYAAAIARWEHVIGRPAPAPLDERGRLNPDLAEWMMGFPAGWTEGKRTDRLRVYGNAVVPQQAYAAWTLLAPKAVASWPPAAEGRPA